MRQVGMLAALLIGLIVGGLGWRLYDNSDQGVTPASTSPQLGYAPSKMMQASVSGGSQSETQDEYSEPLTLEAISKLTSEFEQTLALYNLLDGLGPQEIVELLESAKWILSGQDYVAATSIMYSRLAELNFPLALARVLEGAPIEQRRWLVVAFRALARLDMEQALDRARGLPTGFKSWAAEAILAARDDIPDARRRQIAAEFKAQLLLDPSGDMVTAWQQALEEPDIQQRMRRMMSIADQWGSTDPVAALHALEALSPNFRRVLQSTIVTHWAQRDPDAALEWVQALPASVTKQQLLPHVIGRLAEQDLLRARNIFDTLTAAEQQQATSQLAFAWVRQDLNAAVRWLNRDGEKPISMPTLAELAMRLAYGDPELADRFADALPENQAEIIRTSLIGVLSGQDPQRAAVRVSSLDDPDDRKRAAQQLVNTWAQTDRASTRHWIEEQAYEEQPALFRTLAQQWAQYDMDGAITFARGMEDNLMRDKALLGALQTQAMQGYRLPSEENFAQLEEIYAEIEGADTKQEAAKTLYSVMQRNDPDRANRFRDEAGLPLEPKRQ